MTLMESFGTFVDDLWYVAFVLIIILGLYSTVRLKGLQFTQIREMCRATFSKKSVGDKSTLSPFRVFCMSMANRIGVGNITGPVLAIIIGGPGAIFWMWIFALIGAATSFLESTVGQLYKVRTSNGEFHGGPAYNVSNGLGLRRLSIIVAFIMVLMYIVGFVSMEVSSMTEAMDVAFGFDGGKLIFAIIFTLLTAFIIVGGVRRVSDLAVMIVPAMAMIWLIICVIAVVANYSGIADAFVSIFVNAFSVPSTVGGGVGAMLIIGMKRGILSNEAGIGTIPNISSMADVRHPAAQGLSQSLGVLMDTVVCTLTALVVLTCLGHGEIVDLGLESVPLLQFVLTDTFGSAASYIVAIFLFVFAFTSLMTDYIIGENNILHFGEKRWLIMGLNILILVVVFLSSFYSSDALFIVVDLMMVLCGLVNVFVIFKLGGRAVEAYRDYRRQREEGVEEPEFHKGSLSDTTGITVWDE